jgi:hypothetical protein
MSNISVPNLPSIYKKDPEVGRALQSLALATNSIGRQVNAAPVGKIPPPPPHQGITVDAGGGYFKVNITANSPAFRGAEHMLQVSESATDFSHAHLIHLGASTSWYGQLGPKTLHFASFSQFPTSAPSAPIYSLSADGSTGPIPSITSTQTPFQGYGTKPFTGDTPPIR